MNTNTKKGYIKEVTIREIEAKSILRKYKKIDSWFISHYGMNLYRGCAHNCGKDVTVKVNAIEVLNRELDPK